MFVWVQGREPGVNRAFGAGSDMQKATTMRALVHVHFGIFAFLPVAESHAVSGVLRFAALVVTDFSGDFAMTAHGRCPLGEATATSPNFCAQNFLVLRGGGHGFKFQFFFLLIIFFILVIIIFGFVFEQPGVQIV